MVMKCYVNDFDSTPFFFNPSVQVLLLLDFGPSGCRDHESYFCGGFERVIEFLVHVHFIEPFTHIIFMYGDGGNCRQAAGVNIYYYN